MSAKKAASKKLSVEFSLSKDDGKQWNKPQAAAKAMHLALSKLAQQVQADGRKIGKVNVEIQMDLGAAELSVQGTVSES